jgi:hypothetical protein
LCAIAGIFDISERGASRLAQQAGCLVAQVESDVVVPVEEVSNKAEYAARTIRPKIHRQLKKFLVDLRSAPVYKSSLSIRLKELNLLDLNAVLKRAADRSDRAAGESLLSRRHVGSQNTTAPVHSRSAVRGASGDEHERRIPRR